MAPFGLKTDASGPNSRSGPVFQNPGPDFGPILYEPGPLGPLLLSIAQQFLKAAADLGNANAQLILAHSYMGHTHG